jgi:hypothetical protein
MEVNSMFIVVDRWNVVVRQFEDREDAEIFIESRALERLHIEEE